MRRRLYHNHIASFIAEYQRRAVAQHFVACVALQDNKRGSPRGCGRGAVAGHQPSNSPSGTTEVPRMGSLGTNAQPKEGSAVRSRWKKRRGRVKRGKVCALSRQRSPNCDIIRKSTMSYSYKLIDYSYFQRTFEDNPSTSSVLVLVQDGLFRDWRRRGIPTPATKHRPASQYEGRAFVGVVLSALSLTLSRVC